MTRTFRSPALLLSSGMLLAMGLSIGGGTSFADAAVGESEDDVRIAVDLLDDLSVAATMTSAAATETLGH